MKRLLPVGAIVLALLWSPCWAGLNEGRAAYQRGDFDTAQREIRPAAEAGDRLAQYLLGRLYSRGEGLPLNEFEAAGWYQKSAAAGYGPAQYALALAYLNGEGISQSYKEALRWFASAHQGGIADAGFQLALLYGAGNGVAQDAVESARLMAEAAEQGLGAAQNNLGIAYDLGQGVRASAVVAYALYTLAAENASSSSPQAIANCMALQQKMDGESLSRAQSLARELSKPGQLRPGIQAFLAAEAARRP